MGGERSAPDATGPTVCGGHAVQAANFHSRGSIPRGGPRRCCCHPTCWYWETPGTSDGERDAICRKGHGMDSGRARDERKPCGRGQYPEDGSPGSGSCTGTPGNRRAHPLLSKTRRRNGGVIRLARPNRRRRKRGSCSPATDDSPSSCSSHQKQCRLRVVHASCGSHFSVKQVGYSNCGRDAD